MNAFIAHLVASWSSAYAGSGLLRTFVGFIHIAGLVAGGGAAIAADRATLAAARMGSDIRARQLTSIHATHRIVIIGLGAVIASGVLLFAADTATYLTSRLFWVKMGLLALLMVNGAVLMRVGQRAGSGDERAWNTLRHTAVVSLALWFLTTLAGAGLPNAG